MFRLDVTGGDVEVVQMANGGNNQSGPDVKVKPNLRVYPTQTNDFAGKS